MSNLNHPAIHAGSLTAADLDAARQNNAGRIHHHLHRVTLAQCPPCNGNCRQGRDCPAQQACAPEGGQHAGPVPSRKQELRMSGPLLALLLALLCWVPVLLVVALLMRACG